DLGGADRGVRSDGSKGPPLDPMHGGCSRAALSPRRTSRWGLNFAVWSDASAADLEHLGAALRAGALERRLAVLHRDVLRVLDFDFHLVLDAVGLSHGV